MQFVYVNENGNERHTYRRTFHLSKITSAIELSSSAVALALVFLPLERGLGEANMASDDEKEKDEAAAAEEEEEEEEEDEEEEEELKA